MNLKTAGKVVIVVLALWLLAMFAAVTYLP